ncbi:hypothetical protein N5079_30770 [Planotetraspora sp. A-T 1434]|uniref:hypothetical protein n=1 Tax=Planotetraspora sp. A-T 1434 TaxID=2979219 RepID=UPI0021BEC3F3|nr:hypothetical protein [Planotetraspora sp. A-T 1434]MCT9934598.1 hypothetical protein [Planotetraspora sp. A-T 1434]
MTGRAWVRAYPDIQMAGRRLAAYLGEHFDPTLTDFERLRRFLNQEWARLHPHFYERSIGYLYDLTWFHYMDAKDGFFRTLLDFADEHGLSRIADIGCGVALDAQALLQAATHHRCPRSTSAAQAALTVLQRPHIQVIGRNGAGRLLIRGRDVA